MIERLGFDGSTPRATDGVLVGIGTEDDFAVQCTDDGIPHDADPDTGGGIPVDADPDTSGGIPVDADPETSAGIASDGSPAPAGDGPAGAESPARPAPLQRGPVATTLRPEVEPTVEPLWPDAEPNARVLRAGVEAVLMVADEPLGAATFARALGCGTAAVEDTLADLRIEYDADERGFELREIAGGWRLYTRSAYAEAVERFVLDGQQARLSQAALETLTVVAYRQPVSRSRISAIRGVNVDSVIRTLVNRGLVEEAGTDPDGTATLYRTTPYFLERLGIAGLHELPEVSDFLPEIGSVEDAEI